MEWQVNRKTKAMRQCVAALLSVLMLLGGVLVTPPTPVYSQDGLGFSGTLSSYTEITNPFMTGYNSWPSGFTKGNTAFFDGVFDGTNIWMIPYLADRLMKVNKSSGEMTGYNSWPSGFTKAGAAFAGGVFDGTNIWMIPQNATHVIKVNASTGEMTGYNSWPSGFTKGNSSFQGGVYDGTNIWMIPVSATHVIKVNASTGEMTGYNSWPSGFTKGISAFYGGVFDGTNIWMIPNFADRVIKVNASTGEMTGYNSWPSGFTRGSGAFNGGVFDGTNIWMIPRDADRVIKVNASTGEMTGYNSWPSGFTKGTFAFMDGVFDGTNIWMFPYNADRVIKVNASTGEMTGYNSWPSGFTKGNGSFQGGVYDGTNIWMIPFSADRVIKISQANQAPTDISLSASSIAENSASGSTVGTLSATDADAGDTATYSLVSGDGDTDNASFTIDGTSLKTAASFDYETKSSYSIRVRVTDGAGAIYEEQFTISVTDVQETPGDNVAPSTPGGLASSAITATTATVSWTDSTDNVGVTGYEVYNGATLVGTTTVGVTLDATTMTLSGLVSGSSNTITVIALDAAGNKSAASTALTVNLLDVVVPSVPSGLASSNVTPSGFTVSWTASTDNRAVRSYNVYRNGTFVANVSTNRYTFTGLTTSTTYNISVLAIDTSSNRSAQSAPFAVTTSTPLDVTAPSIPNGLKTTSVSSNRILLTWTPSTDNNGITGYNVYVNNVYVKTVVAPQTELSGLTQLTTYSIQVQALDAVKNRSARSTELSVTTIAPPDTTAPTAPSNLSSSNLTGTSVNVRWDGSTDNVGVTGYNVYVNGVYNKTTTTPATIITGLANLTTYAITVLAVDAAKNRSALSSVLSITTLDSAAPTSPTNVASSNVTKTGALVTWTAATDNVGVTFYNIYRNGTYVGTVNGTTTSYNLSGLMAGTSYNITVRAIDAAKNFTNSTALSVTTLP